MKRQGRCGGGRRVCELWAQSQATRDPTLDTADVSAIQEHGWTQGFERGAEIDVSASRWTEEHARNFGFHVLEWKALRRAAIEAARVSAVAAVVTEHEHLIRLDHIV